MFPLKSNDGILHEVTAVKRWSFLDDIGMLLAQQPTAVGKEESSESIVGISISFAVLVMNSMISRPFVDIILESHAIEDHQHHPKRELCLVGLVSP
jgi:uncharacterized membrane protein